jgi:hypothetical protein
METKRLGNVFLLAIAFVLIISSCKKALQNEEILPQNGSYISGFAGSGTNLNSLVVSPYQVLLSSITNNGNGTFTWVWTITNTSPGNGKPGTGTTQDLSHWGITLGTCATMNDIVSGATSTDGVTWTPFTPILQVDKSQTCTTAPVIKFELGTTGTNKSFYSLTINKDLEVANDVVALFKSGANTGCGTFLFPGFGCPKVVTQGCSLSQGYWLSSPQSASTSSAVKKWTSAGVTVAGFNYSEAESRAIFQTSNAGGIPDSKAGFNQVVAIKLSGSTVSPTASVWADVAIVENWLSQLSKLSPTYLPTGNQAAKEAAGRIGDWINAHHCN